MTRWGSLSPLQIPLSPGPSASAWEAPHWHQSLCVAVLTAQEPPLPHTISSRMPAPPSSLLQQPRSISHTLALSTILPDGPFLLSPPPQELGVGEHAACVWLSAVPGHCVPGAWHIMGLYKSCTWDSSCLPTGFPALILTPALGTQWAQALILCPSLARNP